MSESPLVTVIVPVYKVEQYLDDCLESIVSQTYRNLQIIVVDDGSPDGCPAMCDAWAQRDSRIQVIHKENGGLSSARNAAFPCTNGEYITFVDSDDVIAATFVKHMLDACVHKNVDVAMCGTTKLDEDGVTVVEEERPESQVMSSDHAVHAFLYRKEHMVGGIWGKLFKAHLFDRGHKISFPEGLYSEDYPVEAAVYRSMNAIYIDSEPLYGYRLRTGSICRPDEDDERNKRKPLKPIPDTVIVADLCCQILTDMGYSDTAALNYCKMQGRYDALYMYVQRKAPRQFIRNLQRELVHHTKSVYLDPRVSLTHKIKIFLMSCAPIAYQHAQRYILR